MTTLAPRPCEAAPIGVDLTAPARPPVRDFVNAPGRKETLAHGHEFPA